MAFRFATYADSCDNSLTLCSAFALPVHTRDQDLLLSGGQGLIGLSFDTLSEVYSHLVESYGPGTTLGQTPLSNIFAQIPDQPRCLDLYLQRTADLENSANGTLLIGEHSDVHAEIVKQPMLAKQPGDMWLVALDGILLNGQAIPLPAPSNVTSLKSSGKLGAVIDSGTARAGLPPSIIHATYSSIPGAIIRNESTPSANWFVPCTQAVNISFVFGCVAFLMIPDWSIDILHD